MDTPEYDYVIIGSGPAGMSAAVTARAHGLQVLVLDEQPAVGGQIYRNLEAMESERSQEFQKLGKDYLQASDLARRFRACGATYLPGRSVWQIDPDLTVHHLDLLNSRTSTPNQCRARRLLVTIGAMERPMPLPGWTLPGVMACTAADVLYKSSGLLPTGEIVMAGSGPLLLLIACRLLDAGVKIGAFLDTNPASSLWKALPHLPQALRGMGYLTKGLGMLWKLHTSGVPVYQGVDAIEAQGEQQLEQVRFRRGGEWRTVPADLLLLHHGVVPNVQISRQLGCEHQWYAAQRYWEPVLDPWGNTSVENVGVAGDCGRVNGAAVSELSGQLAALETAHVLGKLSAESRDREALPICQKLEAQQAVRPFLDRLFQPARPWLVPEDEETLVCRCEEVRVRDIRQAVQMGARNPDRVKPMIRCGMGPCQARMCGLTVSEVIADERGLTPEDVGYFRIRSPIKPVTLGELAGLE
jgi:NADPH-dependent 2,4-dienoyl-CoA reductase/sulfur reductase-like enzyme